MSKYISCIEKFCSGDLILNSKQIAHTTSLCTKSAKSINIKARNFHDEFIPLMVYSHFDSRSVRYRMKKDSELEFGYDAIDITRNQQIQIKCLYDKKFWGSISHTESNNINLNKIVAYIKSISYGVVRKHLYSYTNMHIVVHFPIPRDLFNDVEIDSILNKGLEVLNILAKSGNKITITARKPYAGTHFKFYLKKKVNGNLSIKLI